MAEETKLWIRVESGFVLGPIDPSAVALLAEDGTLGTRCEVSLDGVRFAEPWRFAKLREVLPPFLMAGAPSSEAPATGTSASTSESKPEPVSSPRVMVLEAELPERRPPAASGPGSDRAPVPATGESVERRPLVPEAVPPRAWVPEGEALFELRPSVPEPVPHLALSPEGEPSEDRATEEEIVPLRELIPEGKVLGGVPFRLYFLAAATRATGALALRSPQGTAFELFFRKGTPELAWSNAPELDLGTFLIAKGAVTADGLAAAKTAKSAHGGELLNAILAKGLLAPHRAFPLLAEHARTILDRALLLEAGTFHWNPLAAAPAGAFPVGGPWDLLCGAGRRIDHATVRRWLGRTVYRPAARSGDSPVRIEDLRLTAQESRVVASLDGTRSVAELAADHPAEADAILRTTCFLAVVGLVSFVPHGEPGRTVLPDPDRTAAVAHASRAGSVRLRRAATDGGAEGVPTPSASARSTSGDGVTGAGPAARPSVARPAALPTPGSPPAGTGSTPDADLASAEAYLADLDGKDHFAQLGLDRKATPAQIKAAYFRLARTFHPDTAGAQADPRLRQAKHAVTARLNEAYAVLSDDAKRAEYLQALDSGGAQKVDVAALLAAEERFAWATIRVKARRFAEALPALDQAIELNPGEGEFYAWRGYARFSLAPDPKAAEVAAMADVNRALELSPKCTAAWLFAARISATLGKTGPAMDAYRKCLAIDAGLVEAQRELRLLEGRGKTK